MERSAFLRIATLVVAGVPIRPALSRDDPKPERSGEGNAPDDRDAAGWTRRKWTVDGTVREALVRLPPKVEGAPLVLAFHGHGGRVAGTARRWRVDAAWPDAVVVFPQGLPTATPNDPEGERPGWRMVGAANRDLDFVDAVLKTARDEWKVDPDRVHAMGHSNGGGFVYLLYGRRPGVFAALGVVAAAGDRLVARGKACPMIHVAGRADRVVAFAQQEKAVDAVRAINGKQADVEFVAHSGGHMWPLDATAKIVAFLRRHARRSVNAPARPAA